MDTKTFNVFSTGAVQFQDVELCPLAVVAICDAFARRQEGASRCIGTLLGHVDGAKITISDAFTVNHKDEEDGRVMMDQDYHRKMLRLKRKVSPKETVVGWFSTGANISASSVVIQTFYTSKDALFQPTQALPSPLHLIVDCHCADQRLAVKCYANVQSCVDALVQFHAIPVSYKEGGGMRLLPTPGGAAQGGLKNGLDELLEKLQKLHKVTGEVADGKVSAEKVDGAGLRELSSLLSAAEPVFAVQTFEKLCTTSVHDTLMCVYLSRLARSQTALAEKINALTVSLEERAA